MLLWPVLQHVDGSDVRCCREERVTEDPVLGSQVKCIGRGNLDRCIGARCDDGDRQFGDLSVRVCSS